jgi:hypothetical protein
MAYRIRAAVMRYRMFNLRGFDLNLLTVFEAIYEAGTVSCASREAGAQPGGRA